MLRAAARLILPSSGLGYDMPDQAFYEHIRAELKHTPDMAKLYEYSHQLFFSCDATQKGQALHEEIETGEYVCPAYTQKSFNYWQPNSNALPPVPMEAQPGYVKPLPFYPEAAKIKGELHLIPSPVLKKLDTDRENGVQFVRQRVRLIIPYRALKWLKDYRSPMLPPDIECVYSNGLGLTFEKVCIIRAHMYIGRPEYWDPLISAFDYGSVQTYFSRQRSWAPVYYHLRK